MSWQTVIVSIPLVAPFRRQSAPDTEIDPGFEEITELPVHFAARALKLAARTGRTAEASALMLRAASKLMRGDRAGSRETLEQATSRSADLTEGHLLLATLYENDDETPKAVLTYRRIIAPIAGT